MSPEKLDRTPWHPTDPPMRIAYLSGPADAPKSYREWLDNTQSFFGTDYVRQFFQYATDLDADSYIVTWRNAPRDKLVADRFIFENIPPSERAGLMFYFGQILWNFSVGLKMLRFRPDIVVLTGNQLFWWTLFPLSLAGARFLPSFHGVLWPKLRRQSRISKYLQKLNQLLIMRSCRAVVVTSGDIARQVRSIYPVGPMFHHLPSYLPAQFASIPQATWGRPFRTIMVGRVERNKGIFDVLSVAAELERRTPAAYHFDICGIGTALEQARASAPPNVTFHGFCEQRELAAIMGRAHISIVPTRTDFEAGFEMTCAEAILADRPLITSAVCPALEYLQPASIEVTPDDPQAYLDAVLSLGENIDLFEQKRAACGPLKAQFFDQANSWYVAMRNATTLILSDTSVSNADGLNSSIAQGSALR